MDLLESAIADLEACLNLKPGEAIPGQEKKPKKRNNKKAKAPQKQKQNARAPPVDDFPDICKLEFKVGVITKVWKHETADKLYCEEIDVGEESPRQIASGLRPHFTLEEMEHRRLLVVSNLKARNLVGFKSHGMVLCANKTMNGKEVVEFVEPPPEAVIGEVVQFDTLPEVMPAAPSQVDKKKLFQKVMEYLRTNDDCVALYKDCAFVTSAGPCRTRTIANGTLR